MANVVPLVAVTTSRKTAYAPCEFLTATAEPGLAEAATGLTDAQLNAILLNVVEMRRALVRAGIYKS